MIFFFFCYFSAVHICFGEYLFKVFVTPFGIITCGYPSHGLISIRFRAIKREQYSLLKEKFRRVVEGEITFGFISFS